MALISVLPITLMQGSSDEDGDTNSSPQMYVVQLDAKPANFSQVLALAGANIPARGDEDSEGRVCKKRSVARMPNASLLEYVVTCDFEATATENEFEPNPLSRKDDISFDIDSETETFFKDQDDNWMNNVNGEKFDRLPERTTGGVKLVIEGNRSSFSASIAALYTRPSSTNNGSFTVRGITIGEGEAKLTGMSAKPTQEGPYKFWRVKWELPLAPDWLLRIENMGYIELVDVPDFGLVPFPIRRGEPPELITSPWPIAEDGTAMPNQTDVPFIIERKPYPSRSFSIFNWTVAF